MSQNNKITIKDYYENNAIVTDNSPKKDVFVKDKSKPDILPIFLCIIALLSIVGSVLYFNKLYVPVESELKLNTGTTLENAVSSKAEQYKNGKVNLNTANLETLCTLNYIGESKALSIISYRKANGNFKNIEEIKNVKGIGDAIFNKIKDKICV